MITKEKAQHRVDVLKSKHKELHSIIDVLEAEKAPDKIIKNRKKEKLALKDEIEKLTIYISK